MWCILMHEDIFSLVYLSSDLYEGRSGKKGTFLLCKRDRRGLIAYFVPMMMALLERRNEYIYNNILPACLSSRSNLQP